MEDSYKFKQRIIALSNAEIWDDVKTEWKVFNVFDAGQVSENCLCDHPIRYVAVMENRYTKKKIFAGSTCVKSFFEISINFLFTEIKKIQNDTSYLLEQRAFNILLNGIGLTDWEKTFYSDMIETQNIYRRSPKQLSKIEEINKKIIVSYENLDKKYKSDLENEV